MLFDDERTLAWALVEAAAPQLSAAQRNDVHVAIGVGESFGVIHYLITSAADGHITVPAELVHRCVGVANAPARNGGEYQSMQLRRWPSRSHGPTPTGSVREYRTYRRSIE